MTVPRGFAIVLGSGLGFAVAGAAIGSLLAVTIPDYYRGVFHALDNPEFNPLAVGFGLGLTQGGLAGLVVGAVIVLAVAWTKSRVE